MSGKVGPVEQTSAETAAQSAVARETAVVILAAGKGTRMRSKRPKVLHEIAGLSMLGHVLKAATAVKPERLAVVVGHGGDLVAGEARRIAPAIHVATQEPQLGTGHAAAQARPALRGFAGDVFILFGDTPLIRSETLLAMVEARAKGAAVVVLGFEPETPGGYGRLIQDPDGGLARIVEAKDATPAELRVRLCNSGVMCVDGARLFDWLGRIDAANAKGEYYLTDIVGLARGDGRRAAIVRCDAAEVLGVNSRGELAEAEAAFQARARRAAMAAGVTMRAPETVFLAHDTEFGQDIELEPNVFFGPGVRLEDGVVVRAYSHLEGCHVASGAQIGPFARLRPGAEIGERARIGNFVEVKNATFAAGAKANHLAYIGDAGVGADANIGAGVITCNYDGFLKHRTEIGAGAFIGSNTALVAPVEIGARATVGAGSTITMDVPEEALAIGRARQTTRPGLAQKLREGLKAAKAARAAGADAPEGSTRAAKDV